MNLFKEGIENYAWCNIEGELLLAIYPTAIDQQLEIDLIRFVFKEISRRNIPPREYLKSIN